MSKLPGTPTNPNQPNAAAAAPDPNQAPTPQDAVFDPIIVPAFEPMDEKLLPKAQAMSLRFNMLEQKDGDNRTDETEIFDPMYAYLGAEEITASNGDIVSVLAPAGNTLKDGLKDLDHKWQTFTEARDFVKQNTKDTKNITVDRCAELIAEYIADQGDKAPVLSQEQEVALVKLVRNTLPRTSNRGVQDISKRAAEDARRDLREAYELAREQLNLHDEARRKHVAKSRARGVFAGTAAYATTWMYQSGTKVQRRLGATDREEKRGKRISLSTIGILGAAALYQGAKLWLATKGHDTTAMAHANGTNTVTETAAAITSSSTPSHTGTSTAAETATSLTTTPSSTRSTTSEAVATATSTSGSTSTTGHETSATSSSTSSTSSGTETHPTSSSSSATPGTQSPKESVTPSDDRPWYTYGSDAEVPTDKTDTTGAGKDSLTIADILKDTKGEVPSSVTVKSGDTLSQLTLDHLMALKKEAGLKGKVSTEELTKYYQMVAKDSGIKDPNMIHPGDTIKFGHADRSFLNDIFDNVSDGKGDKAVATDQLKAVPTEIHDKAQAAVDKAVAELKLPTQTEMKASLKGDKFTPGQGLYDFLQQNGVKQPSVREGIMDAWLQDPKTVDALTTGDNPLMYTYTGSTSPELRLSQPGALSAAQQELFANSYRAAVAHEHAERMHQMVVELLKKQGLNPDEFDLAA